MNIQYGPNIGVYIKANYPSAVYGVDYYLINEGAGPVMTAWDEGKLGPAPDPQIVADWSAPVSEVDIAKAYAQAYAAAEHIIFLLMAQVSTALVVSGRCTPENVNTEGTRFVKFHRELILDFKNAGRHPDAGTELYNAIASAPSVAQFDWLLENSGAILAIFENGLPRNP